MVLLSVYFISPLLLFWGLTKEPITDEFVASSAVYFLAIFATLFIALVYAKFVFKGDFKDKSIFLASSLMGNTGNLGVPLGIALFGEQSVPYTSIINISNVFFAYIFSVYFYAGKKFDLISTLKGILSIPAIPVSIVALLYNYFGFTLSGGFERFFEMGAYSAIVLQLIIFGIFIAQVKVRLGNWKLALNVSLFKHLLLPFLGFFLILQADLTPLISSVIFLELCVPLAVNNINLSSLFNCKPIDTTFSVIVSVGVFVVLTYAYIWIIHHFLMQ